MSNLIQPPLSEPTPNQSTLNRPTLSWRSLHVKLALTVAAAALLVVAVSGYLFYQRTYNASLQHSEQAVEQLLATVVTGAAIAAYVDNQELAKTIAAGLANNDIVSAAEIRNEHGQLALHGQPLPDGNATWREMALQAPFSEQEIIGTLRAQLNSPLIAERARSTAFANAALLTGQMLAVAILIVLTVYGMMSRTLTYLSRRLHEITPGSAERLKVSRRHEGDEIGLLVRDINGLLGTVETMLNEERELRQQVEALEHRFRGIFEDSSAGIFLLNSEGNLVTGNPAFFRLTGLSAQEQNQLAQRDCVPDIFLDADQARGLLKLAQTSKRPCSADLRLARHTETQEHWSHCLFSPGHGESENPVVEGVLYDITARKQAEAATRRQAERDALTGLFNRAAVDTLGQQLLNDAQAQNASFLVMMLDLDRFKYINDNYGHDAGDAVLKAVADRLRGAVRDSDIVARLGGDEFLLLLPQSARMEEAAPRIAGNLVRLISQPIALPNGMHESIGVSIGIAAWPRHGQDLHLVRKHADAALYEVKRRGRNGYAIRTDDGDHQVQLFGEPLQ